MTETKTKSIAAEIAELRAMDVPALVERYEADFGRPPRVKNRPFLWRRIAWKLQERRLGGLSATAKERLESLIAEIELPPEDRGRTVSGAITLPARKTLPPVGTILTRVWRDRELRATLLEGGAVEVGGVNYGSLSEAARAITGTKWSGTAFFGLWTRKKPK
jgi:hypothetical protein